MITIDGRSVLSRADIHERYGYAMSALERWWKEREGNGHPPIAHRIGNTLYWDEEVWTRWDHRRLNPEPPLGALTRAQLAAEYDIGTTTLDRLWAARETNGHPQPVTTRPMRWDSETWGRWHREYKARTRPKELPPAGDDRDNRDDNELIGGAAFARLLDHRDNSWVSKSARVPPPGFPKPDVWEDTPSGGKRPKWKRRRAQTYADRRDPTAVRRGRTKGSRNAATPYAGDPRLKLARRELASHPSEPNARLIERLQKKHGQPVSYSSWTKILATARKHPEDT